MTIRVSKIVMVFYTALFLGYMIIPLVYMLGATFNDSEFPTLIPWKGMTFKWFGSALTDERLLQATATSIIVGIVVVMLSLAFGLAGALYLSRLARWSRPFTYTVLVSPILIPGIVLGLSTTIFWDNNFGISGSWLLACFSQSSFVSAYCMLIILARLQKLDRSLEEAAMDLGAGSWQVFITIVIPFLRPALITAGSLAFLQSFENYNATLFSIGQDLTLPVYLGSKLRVGITPEVNAVAFVIVVATVSGFLLYAVARRLGGGRGRGVSSAASHTDAELADMRI